jgi:hypothetical protein
VLWRDDWFARAERVHTLANHFNRAIQRIVAYRAGFSFRIDRWLQADEERGSAREIDSFFRRPCCSTSTLPFSSTIGFPARPSLGYRTAE